MRGFLKTAFLAIVILVWPRFAFPVTTQFAAFDLWPSVGDPSYFFTSSSQGLYRTQFSLELGNSFVWRPLDLINVTRNVTIPVVEYFIGHQLSAGVGITDAWQIGMTGTLLSRARFEDPVPNPSPGATSVTEVGDLRVTSKVRLVDSNRSRWGLGVEPFVTIPLGGDDHYLGDTKVNAGGKLIAEFVATERIRLALNVGGEFRGEEVVISNVNFRHRFLSGLGVAAKINQQLRASAELQANTAFAHFFTDRDVTPVEYQAGIQWDLGESGLTLGAGGGSCLVCGVKGALGRGFLNLSYRRQSESFTVKGEREEKQRVFSLKSEEEKFADYILVLKENCPSDPSEFNPEIQDAGCPKYYELKETIVLAQNCPENPDQFDPALHDSSCPKVYTLVAQLVGADQVAVFELREQGRTEQIIELNEQQLRAALFELQERDGDADGIPDSFDNCPEQPEDRNQVADTDGCPEGGIQVTREEIQTAAPVHFGFNQVFLTKEAAQILSNLVAALYYHSEIQVLEVVGHADSIGTQAANQRISRRRAESVVEYLRQCGISAELELRPVGVGSQEPVGPNETAAGRRQNRRVIFRVIQSRPE